MTKSVGVMNLFFPVAQWSSHIIRFCCSIALIKYTNDTKHNGSRKGDLRSLPDKVQTVYNGCNGNHYLIIIIDSLSYTRIRTRAELTEIKFNKIPTRATGESKDYYYNSILFIIIISRL